MFCFCYSGKEALLKAYNKRLKDNVKSIVDNFAGKMKVLIYIKICTKMRSLQLIVIDSFFLFLIEIIKLALIENEGQVTRATQADEDHFEMTVRAANMVKTTYRFIVLISYDIFTSFRPS